MSITRRVWQMQSDGRADVGGGVKSRANTCRDKNAHRMDNYYAARHSTADRRKRRHSPQLPYTAWCTAKVGRRSPAARRKRISTGRCPNITCTPCAASLAHRPPRTSVFRVRSRTSSARLQRPIAAAANHERGRGHVAGRGGRSRRPSGCVRRSMIRGEARSGITDWATRTKRQRRLDPPPPIINGRGCDCEIDGF